ncbi:FtsX-like permease family protein [Microbacterium oleivorans]|uniref:FtsX-like permease family protein n=1 Tax=Microbacterium oleivorans TaxID=273677 RepID=A0A7D5ITP6_9MICO|nr:FtsX-like permease family protein [Microbacterium oleivorans]QLD12454.1 FtsX-like permease family protein [Microbacterium oleivorans]
MTRATETAEADGRRRRRDAAAATSTRGRRRGGGRGTAPETSRAARWRVTLRLAQRQVRRGRASSILIVLLVALPIAGMSGVAVYVDSLIATPEERVSAELGGMQAWVAPVGVPGAGLWQDPTSPSNSEYVVDTGASSAPEGAVRTDIDGVLPAGTEAIPVTEGQARIETVTGAAVVPAWGGEIWDDRFAGAFALVDGRAPRGDGEVIVTVPTLERTGAAVGGTLTESPDGRAYEIVGVFTASRLSSQASAVAFPDATRFESARWYLPDLRLSWPDVQELNTAGILAFSRDVVLDPPPARADGSPIVDERTSSMWQLVVALAAGGAFAAYLVIMLAGAAFAVSARRQQRALAIAASVGADARDLRRTILLQGSVLGGAGGLVGIGAGIGIAAAVIAVTDDGSATGFWGFHVPWPVLAGILVFALAVGTVSALVPARTVAKSDVIGALRGARRPQGVRASRPLWGSAMIIAGVGLTVVSGVAAASVSASRDLTWDSPLRWLPIVGIIAGPVVAQLGVVLSGRWLLWLASLGLSRLGVAARMASRDAVANGSRTVPAFAAVGATVFIGVFAVALGSMTTAQAARSYPYASPVGTATVSIWPAGTNPLPLSDDRMDEAASVAEGLLREAGVERVAMIGRQAEFWTENPDDIPADLVRAVAVTPERSLTPRAQGFSGGGRWSPQNNIAVVSPDDIEAGTGAALSAAQRSAYEDGAALVLVDGLATDGVIQVAAWSERVWQWGESGDPAEAPDNIFEPEPGQRVADPLWSREVPALEVERPAQSLAVAIAPATADALGIDARPETVLGTFADAPTQAQRDRVVQIGSTPPSDDYALSASVEMGPPDASAWLVPLLAAIAVLVLGASSVALGLARFERRPDDATLSAVGGSARLRRSIGFWQGLVIAGFGTLAGAGAGVLPAIGFQMQSTGATGGALPLELADVPWWLVIALAVVLPLAIAVVNWLVPPRHPDLTRRTAIA